MTRASKEKQEEIDKNFEAFSKKIGEYMKFHPGKFAMMRKGEVVEFYDSWDDAYRTGNKFYEDGLFSIQEVNNRPVDLGYFSRALHIG